MIDDFLYRRPLRIENMTRKHLKFYIRDKRWRSYMTRGTGAKFEVKPTHLDELMRIKNVNASNAGKGF